MASTNGTYRKQDQAEKRIDPKTLPPNDVEAERHLLGSILMYGMCMVDVQPIVRPDDFFIAVHRTIYTAACRVFDRQMAVDLGTVTAELRNMGVAEDDTDYSYVALSRMVNDVASAANAVSYARIVEAHGTSRRMLAAVGQIAGKVYDAVGDPDTAIEEGTRLWMDATTRQGIGEPTRLGDLIEHFITDTEARRAGDMFATSEDRGTIIATGFQRLDALLGGQHPQDMIAVAGRPGLGKTSLLVNLAIAACQTGQPAGLFSLEMGLDQIATRIVAAHAEVDMFKLRTGDLDEAAWQRALTMARIDLTELPLYLDCEARLTITELRTRALRMRHKYGIKWLGVDYLQLVAGATEKGKRYGNRVDEVSEVSRAIKALARELNIPVVCAVQLNRSADEHKGPPTSSMIRESGQIEQDADVILILWSGETVDETVPATERPPVINVEAHIVKHRNGPVGVARMRFDRPHTKFDDRD